MRIFLFGLAVISLLQPVHSASAQAAGEFADSHGPRFLYAPAASGSTPIPVDVSKVAKLRQRIAVNAEGLSPEAALNQIAERAGLRLTYPNGVLSGRIRVHLKADDITVAGALTEVLRDAGVDVVLAAGDQIVLVKRPPPPQLGTIAGRVTDAKSGTPLSDVSVVVGDTRLGVVTAADGTYRIANVPVGSRTVTARRIGYSPLSESVVVTDGTTSTVDFALQISATNLSQVVITGTAGNQTRAAQPALVASIDATSVVDKAPVSNVTQLLEARVPGITTTEGSGTTGAAARINIRGAASLALSNEPLVFIDGVRVQGGQRALISVGGQTLSALNDLNPNDIESIEVVKGPAAATLYGADASAGVIQIITKKGKAGSKHFVQNVSVEYNSIKPNFTPAANYAVCSTTDITAGGPVPCAGKTAGTIVSDNPLVREGAFRDGSLGSLNYSGQGGGENFGYYLSLGALNEQGTTRNNLLNRRTGEVNLNWVAGPKLSLDARTGMSRNNYKLPPGDQDNYSYLFEGGLGSPLTVGQDANGMLTGGYLLPSLSVPGIANILSEVTTLRWTPSIQANYTPFENFTNRITVGSDIARSAGDKFYPLNDQNWYFGDQANGYVENVQSNTDIYTVDYLGNIKTTFGHDDDITSDFSFGSQFINTTNSAVTTSGIGLTTNSANLISGTASRSAGQNYNQQKSFGVFGQEQLGFNDRLFLQVGARVDRNSSFGTSAGSFFLPKAGVSYVISQEPFWNHLASIVPTLRLRAAYGTTGRSPVPGASLETYAAAPAVTRAGALQPGFLPLNPGNTNLKPERGKEFEAGFDASFFNDRAGLEFTYYDKRTSDLLLQQPQAPSSGFIQAGSFPYVNLGKVRNSGVEFSLRTTPIDRKRVRWDATFNGSTLDNELVSLGTVPPFTNSVFQAFVPGRQLGSWFVNRIRSVDLANNVVIVSDTAEYLGNTMPTFTGSLNTTLTLFGNLRIYALFDTKRGYRVWNFTQEYRDRYFQNSAEVVLPAGQGGYSAEERLRRFGPYVGETNGLPVGFTDVKEDYMQSGDFVRFRELSATFTLPDRLVRHLGAGGASVTVGGRNLHLWTRYGGRDPEVEGFGPGSAGGPYYTQFYLMDLFTTPPVRRWIARLNLQF